MRVRYLVCVALVAAAFPFLVLVGFQAVLYHYVHSHARPVNCILLVRA